jgi:nucleoid-associated protein YgaU
LTITMALLRLGAIVAVIYLAVVMSVALVGNVLRLSALIRVSQALALPGTRVLVRNLAGLSLSALTLAGPLTATAHASPAPDRPAPEDRSTAALTLVEAAPTASGIATLEQVDGPVSTTTMSVVSPTAPTATTEPSIASMSTEPQSTPATRVVQHGDHLWSISQATLTEAWGRVPTDAEVHRYWRSVIAANPTVTDPDLLFAGQRVTLPPCPPPDLRP